MDSEKRIVEIAQVSREHGVPREGRYCFRAQLFSRGATYFRGLKEVYKVDADGSLPLALDSLIDRKALGGKWEDCSALLICVSEAGVLQRGDRIAVARTVFPKIDDGFYLCDLMGVTILDDEGQRLGKVVRFFDNSSGTASNINLEVRASNSEVFEMPMALFKESGVKQSAEGFIVPGARFWSEFSHNSEQDSEQDSEDALEDEADESKLETDGSDD